MGEKLVSHSRLMFKTENSNEHNMLFRILWTNTERISSKTEIASGERKMEDFYGAMLNCSI